MYTYHIWLVNRVSQFRICAGRIWFSNIILRSWSDERVKLLQIFLGIMVGQHVWVVDLLNLKVLESLLVGVAVLEVL